MKRTQIQLDEETYRALKQRAFDRGISMSALLREMIREQLAPYKVNRKRRIEDFKWIGSASSDQGDLAPISERHDEALAEDLLDWY